MGQVVNYALGSAQVFGKSKSAYYVKDPFVYLMLHTWYNHPVHFYEFYNFVLHYLHHPDLYPPVGRSRSAWFSSWIFCSLLICFTHEIRSGFGSIVVSLKRSFLKNSIINVMMAITWDLFLFVHFVSTLLYLSIGLLLMSRFWLERSTTKDDWAPTITLSRRACTFVRLCTSIWMWQLRSTCPPCLVRTSPSAIWFVPSPHELPIRIEWFPIWTRFKRCFLCGYWLPGWFTPSRSITSIMYTLRNLISSNKLTLWSRRVCFCFLIGSFIRYFDFCQSGSYWKYDFYDSKECCSVLVCSMVQRSSVRWARLCDGYHLLSRSWFWPTEDEEEMQECVFHDGFVLVEARTVPRTGTHGKVCKYKPIVHYLLVATPGSCCEVCEV